MNKNFDSILHENQYLEKAYLFIESINNRLNNDYKKIGFEIYNQHDSRFDGSIVFRKSISHTSSDPKHSKVTYYDYVKFISIDYHISLDGFVNFIINKIDKSPIKELDRLKLDVSNTISNSDYKKLTEIVSKGLKVIDKNFSDILNKNIEDTKKKIPSMDVKELINTWLNGYHPECLSLALHKIVENEDKYPKIAKLFYELQDELSKLSKESKNFSERLMKCFSEKYTQVFDFSIEGKLLPTFFEQEVIDAGYKVEDTSSTAGRGGLDSIAIEVEREPVDRLNEVVQFVAKKFNVDPSKVKYSKWD